MNLPLDEANIQISPDSNFPRANRQPCTHAVMHEGPVLSHFCIALHVAAPRTEARALAFPRHLVVPLAAHIVTFSKARKGRRAPFRFAAKDRLRQ